MLVLKVSLPSGRYIAGPDRPWPLSPLTLAGELAHTCMREVPNIQGERLERVIDLLTGPVDYALPMVVQSEVAGSFRVIGGLPLFMVFRSSPSREELFDLRQLLCFTKKIGKNPVWVDAEVACHSDMALNCTTRKPGHTGCSISVKTLRTRDEFRTLKTRFLHPANWIETIIAASDNAVGPNNTPVYSEETYLMPAGLVSKGRETRCVIFRIDSPNELSLKLALPLAETLRRKLMGISRRLHGSDRMVSQVFSGKKADGSALEGHRHAFILPLADGVEGSIGKIVVKASEPFTEHEIACLLSTATILPEGLDEQNLRLEALLEDMNMRGASWVSATPFVTARHHRSSRGEWIAWMKEELIRELKNHGLPEPVSIEMNSHCSSIPVREFSLARKGLPAANAAAFTVNFNQELSGPFSLGHLCHFGLGTLIRKE